MDITLITACALVAAPFVCLFILGVIVYRSEIIYDEDTCIACGSSNTDWFETEDGCYMVGYCMECKTEMFEAIT